MDRPEQQADLARVFITVLVFVAFLACEPLWLLPLVAWSQLFHWFIRVIQTVLM